MRELPRPEYEWPAAPDFAPLRKAFEDAITKGKDGRAAYAAWSAAWRAHADAYAEVSRRIDAEHRARQEECGWLNVERGRLVELARHVGGDVNMGARGTSTQIRTADVQRAEEDAWRERLAAYAGEQFRDMDMLDLIPLVPYRQPDRVVDTTQAPLPYTQALDVVLNASMTTNA